MKQILLATTALVVTAGVAAAEVSVSGEARIGLRYESDTGYGAQSLIPGVGPDGSPTLGPDGSPTLVPGPFVNGDNSTNVVNRIRVEFELTGETEGGLSFGASIRSDQDSADGDNSSATDGDIWISGTYGKLTVGDIDDATENAIGDLPEVGLTGLDFWNEFAYATSEEDDGGTREVGDAGVLYEYSIGSANLYASFKDGYIENSDIDRDTASWALGANYDYNGFTFGIGYEQAGFTLNPFVIDSDEDSSVSVRVGPFGTPDDSETWGLSGGGELAGVTFKAVYLKTDSDNDEVDYQQYGVGASYELSNGLGLAAFYRKNDADNIPVKGHAFGLGANYDLGGGAMLKGGIVATSIDYDYDDLALSVDNTLADFGIEFEF